MISFPFQLNTPDPTVLTVFVIGTKTNIHDYILTQYHLGYAEVGDWSPPQPVPNCPGTFMSLLHRTIMPED